MKLEPKRTAIISLDVQNDLVNNTQGAIESGAVGQMAAAPGAGRNDHGKRQENFRQQTLASCRPKLACKPRVTSSGACPIVTPSPGHNSIEPLIAETAEPA